MERDRLSARNIGCQREFARQTLLPRVPAAGEASADTGDLEQATCLVASRPEEVVGACHDVVQRVTAQ